MSAFKGRGLSITIGAFLVGLGGGSIGSGVAVGNWMQLFMGALLLVNGAILIASNVQVRE